MPGNLFGNDLNVVFQSSRIDFSQLPVVGSWYGFPLYELALSQWGLQGPIAVNQGQTYSLVLVNYSNTGGQAAA
jgi:hypothetical protein